MKKTVRKTAGKKPSSQRKTASRKKGTLEQSRKKGAYGSGCLNRECKLRRQGCTGFQGCPGYR